jgi:hypothetical protein
MSEETRTKDEKAEPEFCPTRVGKYTAYQPEYRDEYGKWRSIQTHMSAHGVPQPISCGGLNSELGLFGYEQAWALAWSFSAIYAARSFGPMEIRVAQFDVTYELQARRLEMLLTPGA